MSTMQPTPDNLRHVRASCGLTQREAAELMMLAGPMQISHYETGFRAIDPARFALLLIRCGLDPDYVPRQALPTAA